MGVGRCGTGSEDWGGEFWYWGILMKVDGGLGDGAPIGYDLYETEWV